MKERQRQKRHRELKGQVYRQKEQRRGQPRFAREGVCARHTFDIYNEKQTYVEFTMDPSSVVCTTHRRFNTRKWVTSRSPARDPQILCFPFPFAIFFKIELTRLPSLNPWHAALDQISNQPWWCGRDSTRHQMHVERWLCRTVCTEEMRVNFARRIVLAVQCAKRLLRWTSAREQNARGLCAQSSVGQCARTKRARTTRAQRRVCWTVRAKQLRARRLQLRRRAAEAASERASEATPVEEERSSRELRVKTSLRHPRLSTTVVVGTDVSPAPASF